MCVMQDFHLKYYFVKDSRWIDHRPKNAYSFIDNDRYINDILSVCNS